MDYSKLYSDLVSFRKLNPLERSEDLYTEDHHILPRCLGGCDEPENLIRLTAREHCIAHRLLAKIYPDNAGLARAVLLMTRVLGRDICSREYDRLKKLASECTSKRVKELWKDPEYREMMRQSCYENEEVRSKISSASLIQWESPEHRNYVSKKNSERGLEIWKDPAYVETHFESRRKFFENNTMPWQRPKGIPTKEIWSLAQVFWEHRPNNPDATQTYTIKRFCEIFNEGKNLQIFATMNRRFNVGWVPNLDLNWLTEFGHIHY